VQNQLSHQISARAIIYKNELAGVSMSSTIINAMFDNMVTSIILVDQSFVVKANNQAAEQLFELGTKRILGSHLASLYQHLSSKQVLLKQALTTNQGFTDNLATLVCHDLRRITVDLCVTPIFYQGEQHLILELRQVDQQQRISTEMQQITQQQLAKDLVKGLAHEIKNPLGGLRGAAQLLHRQLDDENREYTQMIIEQADRLNNLVERLLGPNKHHQHSLHNIHKILETIITLMSFELPAGITIERDYDPSIPDIMLDAEQIQQALLNILQNAIQALGNTGHIKIVTRIANQVTINGKRHRLVLDIKIIDDGPGIPPELKNTLFYPMVTGRAEGTGLGLSITQTLIQQHQGRVDFLSAPGKTEFNVTIPVQNDKEIS